MVLNSAELRNGLVVTALWKAKADQSDAVAGILHRFAPQAQQDPGVQAFVVHRSRSDPAEFFFYEVFENEQALEAHQKTPHFKALITVEALPRLEKRERSQYSVI